MYKQILVPLDGSDTSRRGLGEAISLARALKAELVLLHVVEDLSWLVDLSSAANSPALHDDVRRHGEQMLARAKQAAAMEDVSVRTLLLESTGGRPAQAIVGQAVALGCDLIVMGTHGRKALGRLVLGSDAMSVVQGSPVPVMLVKPSNEAG